MTQRERRLFNPAGSNLFSVRGICRYRNEGVQSIKLINIYTAAASSATLKAAKLFIHKQIAYQISEGIYIYIYYIYTVYAKLNVYICMYVGMLHTFICVSVQTNGKLWPSFCKFRLIVETRVATYIHTYRAIYVCLCVYIARHM